MGPKIGAGAGIAAAGLAGVLALACGSGPSRPNVILVLVDTLRPDFLTIYEPGRPTSPHLAAFARESVVFDDVTSQSPCTYPSVNSLLTSRYPDEFLVQPEGAIGIPGHLPTMAAILKQHGYATHAVSASPIVRNGPSRWNPSGGFGAGFDVFDEDCLWQDARCVTRAALARLATTPQPFFLYLHYMDPHDPYAPPPSFERRFSKDYAGGKAFIERGDPTPIERMLYADGPPVSISEADVEHLKGLYADEVAFFDASFHELVEGLRQRGLLDESIVVVASDHGEEFLEHGHIKHCRTVFRTLTWTPLVLRLPDAAHVGRRRSLAQNLDLLPTLLDLAGLDWRDLGLAGTSLRPVIERDESVQEFAVSLDSVRTPRFKLIYHLDSGTSDLYDLAEDPGETTDVSDAHPEVHSQLMRQLERWVGFRRGDGRSFQERLKALGYLE